MLDALDTKIYLQLQKGAQNIAALALAVGVGRTTVRYRLERLRKSERVRSTRRGRDTLWELSKIQYRDHRLVRVYRRGDIVHVLDRIVSLPKHTIIFAVQGLDAAGKELEWIPLPVLKKYHQGLRRKQIKILGCLPQQAFETLLSSSTDILLSHLGRSGGSHAIISPQYFQGSCSIIVSSEFIVLLNAGRQRALLISDRQLAQIMYESYMMFFNIISERDNPKSVDVNKLIYEELQRRKALPSKAKRSPTKV